MVECTEFCMRCVRLEAALEREATQRDAWECAVLDLWELLTALDERG